VVIGVDIPGPQHRALIGRGGQNLNDLQNKFNVQIQFPGSRSYNQAGEPENLSDLSEADPANIVKVSGSRAACEKTIAALKVCSSLYRSVSDSHLFIDDIRRMSSRLLLTLKPSAPQSLFP